MPSTTQPNIESITTINRSLLFPCKILCNCEEVVVVLDNDNMVFLHKLFSYVLMSLEIQYAILPHVDEYARKMSNLQSIWKSFAIDPSQNLFPLNACMFFMRSALSSGSKNAHFVHVSYVVVY
ncbi:hypothetical protein CR513_53588, partial [Mucuna pruriens]